MSYLTTVIILASDKESLKKSLIHVDEFLKKVGQRIETERGFLHSVGRRTGNSDSDYSTFTTKYSPVTIDGVSNEDYSNLWFGGNKFDDTPKTIRKKASDENVAKDKEKFSKFYKAFATLDDEQVKKGTTMKLVNAIHDLKELVETDVDVKIVKNVTKLDALRQIQEELKKKDIRTKVNKAVAKTNKSKRDNDGNNDEFDVFGGMEFPENSNLPSGFTTKAPSTGGGTPPEILDDKFIKENAMPGPGVEVLMTPSTTTDDYERLLSPADYGYTTSRKPIATYGDISLPPHIHLQYLTTTPAPTAFVASLKEDMKKFQMGVFSIALVKIFHMIIWKNQAEATRIAYGIRTSIVHLRDLEMFQDFGESTLDALNQVSERMADMPYDEMRTQVVILHNGLLHRRELFSGDVNSLLDRIDSLYTRSEANELLESLEPLESYHEPNEVPYTALNKILDKVLAPWVRIKDTPRGKILKQAINRAIHNHFYVGPGRRSINIKIPVELIPSYKPGGRFPPPGPAPGIRADNIQVFSLDTRRDDLNKNIYNADLQTIYNNFMRTKINEQASKKVNTNAKPLFNKQLKDNLKIFNKKEVEVDYKQANNFLNRISEKQANLRINLNAKVTSKPNGNRIMIITNNQAKSNIVGKPRTLFRSGDSYFNVMNLNDTLVHDANQFELDMYPDVPMMVTDPPLPLPPPPPPPPPPQPSELNFQIEGDKLNLQLDGDKKVIVINKENDVPRDTFGEDIDLKMTSSSSSSLRIRKHHKKHHKKHKRTHAHNNLKEKLAKIKKIVKMYRSGHKKSKRKHHHRRNKHKKALRSLSIKDQTITLPPIPIVVTKSNNYLFNSTTMNRISDRRFQIKDSLSTTRQPLVIGNIDYTTQVYAVRSNFINSLRRKMIDDEKKVNLVTQESLQSDEEITLRKKLYKAMSLGRAYPRSDMRRLNKRRFLQDSSASDEEAQLKNKIYNYFNNIQPE